MPQISQLMLNISTKKDNVKNKNIYISSLKEYFTNLRHRFLAHKYKNTMQQKLAFGNNIGEEPQKPRPKLKNMYIIYLLGIFALPAIQYNW